MATTWRTKPEYRGEVADGFYQTADGRLHYRPAPDVEDLRRRLDALLGESLTAVPVLRVSGVSAGGRLPSAEQVAAIENELAPLPTVVLGEFIRRGGAVDVVAGRNAMAHPRTPVVERGRNTFGWFCAAWPLIVVAADAERGTAIHEAAHALDFGATNYSTCGRISCSPEWHRLAEAEKTVFLGEGGPLSGLYNAHRNPAESFAEAVMLYFLSPDTRHTLMPDTRRFIERACT